MRVGQGSKKTPNEVISLEREKKKGVWSKLPSEIDSTRFRFV